ncbi:unnamed protein product [Brassica napus]|uniref:(rape) hypothetical protein n=1 Tax=Brassica napus TaxID=3708 RepID=A0A816ZLB5_BRANA|nr:unnamed protein product [Brassica napus]
MDPWDKTNSLLDHHHRRQDHRHPSFSSTKSTTPSTPPPPLTAAQSPEIQLDQGISRPLSQFSSSIQAPPAPQTQADSPLPSPIPSTGDLVRRVLRRRFPIPSRFEPPSRDSNDLIIIIIIIIIIK